MHHSYGGLQQPITNLQSMVFLKVLRLWFTQLYAGIVASGHCIPYVHCHSCSRLRPSKTLQKVAAAFSQPMRITYPSVQGITGAIERANDMAASIQGAHLLGQFENPANPAVHYQHTGPEIWDAMEGEVDYLVAGVGTGGTIAGAGRYDGRLCAMYGVTLQASRHDLGG